RAGAHLRGDLGSRAADGGRTSNEPPGGGRQRRRGGRALAPARPQRRRQPARRRGAGPLPGARWQARQGADVLLRPGRRRGVPSDVAGVALRRFGSRSVSRTSGQAEPPSPVLILRAGRQSGTLVETMTDESWTRYKLQRKLFSVGEDFLIENDRGEPVFKVDGKVLRIRETFVLQDL